MPSPPPNPGPTAHPDLDSGLIPRALLLGNPERGAPQLSPDGRQLSFVAPLDGVLNLWLAPVDAPEAARPLTQDRGAGIRQHGWLHDGSRLWYLQDEGGNENFHLYSLALDGSPPLDLTPQAGIQARLIGLSRRHPRAALVGINDRDRRWHDVYRIDLHSGAAQLLLENPGYAQFLADEELRLRLAFRNSADGGRELLVAEDGAWRPLFRIGKDEVMSTLPLAIGKDPWLAYGPDSRGRDTAAAVEFDLRTGASRLLGEHPKTDVLALSLNPLSLEPEAYLCDYLRPEWRPIGDSLAADRQRLTALGLEQASLSSRSADDRRWILSLSHDRLPGHYYLYERDPGRARRLYSARPELDALPLARSHSRVIRARDGLELVSYLSLPPALDQDGRPPQPLPLLLLVHGGPWARDGGGYKPEHQFWANRGYAVLSVNFRGSTGFGKAFTSAGDREWGRRMHEDLLDAVDWAVAEGIALRERVGILGGSYGGYATLAALAFTPEVFACGIDLVGPSNLETLLASFPPYWAPLLDTFRLRVGDPQTEEGRALLRERSPLHRCQALVRPLLIVQGANDVRVTRAESDQMVAAMQAAGVPVSYALYPDEGHGLARAVNRLSFMALAEAFLARFLGGASEPYGEALRQGSLRLEAGIEHLPGAAEALAVAGG